MSTAQRDLLERDRELAILRAGAEAASAGGGCAVLVRGEAGVGKTALLHAAAANAADLGFRVLMATGSELERDLGFALIRTLFGTAATEVASDGSGGPAGVARRILEPGTEGPTLDVSVACHALQWLCSDLAERTPIALLVDDAHWADEPSVRALLYLARRLEGAAILLVVGYRTGEPQTGVVDRFESAGATALTLPRLSPAATAELLRPYAPGEPDPELITACHDATGGNPFLLRALVGAMLAADLPFDAAAAGSLEALYVGSVARSLEARLARLPDTAAALARAVSVFATTASLRGAAAVAGLSEQDAAQAADLLAGAEVLLPGRALRFVHPLLRTAAYESHGPSARALAHRRAASILAAEGAEPEAVAAHLMRAQPAGDQRAVDTLLIASRRALSGAAPETALAVARRALAEPPASERRWDVLHALGRAAVSVAWDEATAILREASVIGVDPVDRAQSLLLWTQAWSVTGGDTAELRAAIEAILPEIDRRDPLLAGRLRVRRRLLLGDDEVERELSGAAPRADISTLEGRVTLVQWAWRRAVGARCPAHEAAAAVRHALDAGGVVDWNDPTTLHQYAQAIDVLRLSGAIDDAERLLDAGIDVAARMGDDLLTAMGTALSADYMLERGELADALALATTARDIAARPGPQMLPVVQSSGVIATVLVERGEVEAAAAAVDALDDPELPDVPRAMAATAHSSVLLARGLAEDAARLALAHGRGRRAATVANPALDGWRAVAAEGLARSGDAGGARELTAETLHLARRWGTPAPLGEAHRLAGRHAATPGDALKHFSRAVELLRPTHAQLWLARALTDQGAALRRAHSRNEARQPLRDALDLASRCGALELASRAEEELRAAGARPRRPAARGVDALTPSELRVCRLAAKGLSNRDIAQTLFVTLRTVETHLTASYAKLQISGRRGLATALTPISRPHAKGEH